MKPEWIDRFRRNLERVHERMAEAARRAARSPAEVQLIAISKYAPAEVVRHLVWAGAEDLGENRPQSLWEKCEAIDAPANQSLRWHLVGHLQRNKARRTLPLVHAIHSLDSARLLDALQQEASDQGLIVTGFLEVNVTQDHSKTGLAAEEARQLIERHGDWPNLNLIGLMGMASLDSDSSGALREFEVIRRLRDDLSLRSGLPLHSLSMGMSGDFEEAIAQGATHVRVGSSLFEGIEWNEAST